MKKYFLAAISIASLLLAGFYQNLKPGNFIGTWQLVSVESIAENGSINYPYGKEPAGRMMIDNNGNYIIEIYTSSRSNILSGNKNTATPAENSMMVKGSNAHYGKFSADINAKTLLFKPEKAFFPNWEGENLTSTFTYEDSVLKSYSRNTTFGGSQAIVTWEKIK